MQAGAIGDEFDLNLFTFCRIRLRHIGGVVECVVHARCVILANWMISGARAGAFCCAETEELPEYGSKGKKQSGQGFLRLTNARKIFTIVCI